MEFYKRFLIGLALTILAIIIGFGFWYFNHGMFGNVIFSDSKPKKIRQVRGVNNPFRLEIKVKGTSDAKQINYLPENKEVERSRKPGVILEIPFTSQAPFGEWQNPIYQDGCEEAAVLMSIYWVRGKDLSRMEANRKIADMANWQIEKYGEFRDTSVEDTVGRIFKEYFGYNKVVVRESIKIEDIISELDEGRAVIVPTNGRLLGNPYYTPPGPARHNLVIKGYDEKSREFITNDPGTKSGEAYRYKVDVVFGAIRDYPSGYHVSIEKVDKKMIVVSK